VVDKFRPGDSSATSAGWCSSSSHPTPNPALPHLTSVSVRGARTRVVFPACGLRKLHADYVASAFSDAVPDVAGTYAPVLFGLNVDQRTHRDRLQHFHLQTYRRAVNASSPRF
jgi:hypothetical protein